MEAPEVATLIRVHGKLRTRIHPLTDAWDLASTDFSHFRISIYNVWPLKREKYG